MTEACGTCLAVLLEKLTGSTDGQEIHRALCNRKVHYRDYTNTRLASLDRKKPIVHPTTSTQHKF